MNEPIFSEGAVRDLLVEFCQDDTQVSSDAKREALLCVEDLLREMGVKAEEFCRERGAKRIDAQDMLWAWASKGVWEDACLRILKRWEGENRA